MNDPIIISWFFVSTILGTIIALIIVEKFQKKTQEKNKKEKE